MRGKRGRGAGNKTLMFLLRAMYLATLREGMLKRNGYVYTQVVNITCLKNYYLS
ncbi:hypothetical protein [Campylobacter troglodytis]|uniref:hypothetical protein n=1 Tax=Campylobacter troglodytis TaxID=654363 RepID=UPI00163C5E36|nr:hypothetical protein [Campylobacter troglodytis]